MKGGYTRYECEQAAHTRELEDARDASDLIANTECKTGENKIFNYKPPLSWSCNRNELFWLPTYQATVMGGLVVKCCPHDTEIKVTLKDIVSFSCPMPSPTPTPPFSPSPNSWGYDCREGSCFLTNDVFSTQYSDFATCLANCQATPTPTPRPTPTPTPAAQYCCYGMCTTTAGPGCSYIGSYCSTGYNCFANIHTDSNPKSNTNDGLKYFTE